MGHPLARVETNLPDVSAALGRLAAVGRWSGPGRWKTLAEDARDVIAQGLYDRYVLAQKRPDGSPLARLSRRYLARKLAQGYPATVGVRTGHMLALDQLRGEVKVAGAALEMTYGADDAARLEMEWFTEGSARRHRPPRPGYELDESIERDLDDLVLDALDRAVTDLGGESL